MPIMVFCEECGERHIIQEDTVDSENIRLECQRCGEVIIVKSEQIKDLDRDA